MLTDAGPNHVFEDVVVNDVVMGAPSASTRDALDEGASVTVLEGAEDVMEGAVEVEGAGRSEDEGVDAERHSHDEGEYGHDRSC